MRVTVLGAGSWGTAFAQVLCEAGNDVVMWGHDPEVCATISTQARNPRYHPGIALPAGLRATPDASLALRGAELVVVAVPSQTLRDNLERWADDLPPTVPLVSLMKGIELGTAKRMTEVIGEVLGAGPDRLVVVSGPNLAGEVIRRQPSASVVACADEAVAQAVQRATHTGYFRPYTNTDVVGTELGGSVKNVIALATGIAVGLGYGDNTRATVVTRGLAETARLGAALGAEPSTFMGLAGLGDLVATCTSPLSRNRTFGERLGQGRGLAEIAGSTHQVAEGVKSCESILDLAGRHGIEMPIVEAVVRVVRGEVTPQQMVDALVSREARPEFGGYRDG